MTVHSDLMTAMDACRPNSGDLSEPEMEDLRAAVETDSELARRFQALQQFDTKLGDVIRQGDVPIGLESRILESLNLESLETSRIESSEARSPGSESRKRPSRRRVWAAVAVAATAAAVATGVVAWSLLMGNERLTLTDIRQEAPEWCDALDPEGWQVSEPPPAYRFASEITLDPNAWQEASLPRAAGKAVAYRLPLPRGVRRMTLLVLKAELSGEAPRVPPTSPYKTQDRLVAAWQIAGNVYVLVIQGDDLGILQESYDRYVQTDFKEA